jgi:hypothetical protein
MKEARSSSLAPFTYRRLNRHSHSGTQVFLDHLEHRLRFALGTARFDDVQNPPQGSVIPIQAAIALVRPSLAVCRFGSRHFLFQITQFLFCSSL